jgi:hypothetical protein
MSDAKTEDQPPRPSPDDQDLTVREEPREKLDKMSLDVTNQAVLPWQIRKDAAEERKQRDGATLVGVKRPALAPKAKAGSLWGPIGVAYALVALCGSGYLYLRGAQSTPPPERPGLRGSVTAQAPTPIESVAIPLAAAPLPVVQAAASSPIVEAPAPSPSTISKTSPPKSAPAPSAAPKRPVTPQGFLDQP